MQARFYQYYAYLSNVLDSGVGTPVRKALAFIFVSSMKTSGSTDISAVKTDYKAIDKAIVETVYTYFNDIFLANKKPLWVTTVARNNKYDFFEDNVVNHKETEIMITNYKVEHVEVSPLYPKASYEVYTFKDFIYKLGHYLQ